MKKYFFPFLVTALFAFSACNKDAKMVDATVVDTQDLTYVGCGYVLELEDKALILPLNLPSAYQHDGMKVKIEFKHTGIQDTCKFGTVIYDMVDIQEIKRAL